MNQSKSSELLEMVSQFSELEVELLNAKQKIRDLEQQQATKGGSVQPLSTPPREQRYKSPQVGSAPSRASAGETTTNSSSAVSKLISHVRGFLQRRRFKKSLLDATRTLSIDIIEANGISGRVNMIGTKTEPDAYVTVSSLLGGRNKPGCFSTVVTSSTKGFDPSWNQRLRLSSVGSAVVCFSILARGNVVSNDTLLGQATLDLDEYPSLFTSNDNSSIDLTLTIGIPQLPVFSQNGAKMKLLCGDCQGTMKIRVSVSSLLRNIGGAFWNMKSNIFGNVSREKIWAVLRDDHLYIFDSPFERECIQKVNCSLNILGIEEKVYDKKTEEMDSITIRLFRDENLVFGWGDSALMVRNLWIRALLSYIKK